MTSQHLCAQNELTYHSPMQVSSKSKKSALKWLGALEGDEGGRAGEIADTERDETSGKSRAMEVIDIDEGGKLQVL
jgi:hypothetical protein